MKTRYSTTVTIHVSPEDKELWNMMPGNRAQWFRGALRERMKHAKGQYIKVISDLPKAENHDAISAALSDPKSAETNSESIQV
jgi:hypothetical protein